MRTAAWVLSGLVWCGTAVAGAPPDGPRDRTRAPLPEGAIAWHTVKSGETLGDISRQHYGSTQHWKRIADANGITDPRRVPLGMILVIPSLTGPLPRPAVRPDTASRPTAPAPPPPRPPAPAGASKAERAFLDTWGRLLAGSPPWWVLIALPLGYVTCVATFWVSSNIVHTAHMTIRRAAVCALLVLLVDVGCVVLGVLLWSAVAEEVMTSAVASDAAPLRWSILTLLALYLLSLIAQLIVIKFVYRDTVGKTLALWLVAVFVGAFCFGLWGVPVALFI